jgi:1-deoxy-D-xylulose 5-phosphate reductoisomerase
MQGKIGFPSIYEVVRETLDRMPSGEPHGIEEILEIDQASRATARALVQTRVNAVTA